MPRPRILRHRQEASGVISTGDPRLIEAVSAHVGRFFAPPTLVQHDLVADTVHVDVHVVPPSSPWPVYTLVTSGMSERPMPFSDGPRWAELMMMLPEDWPAPSTESFTDQSAYWPYRLLQDLARFPHLYDTALWKGHSVPNGEPAAPYAPGSPFVAALLASPVIAPDGFSRLHVDGRDISILSVLPLQTDELELRLASGLEPLLDALDAAGVTEILNPNRPSAVAV